MGVEYRHFLVVNDPGWLPREDTASRVEAVLREWGIVVDRRRVINLADGRQTTMDLGARVGDAGHGVAILFAGTTGAAVQRVAGPSLYGAGVDDGSTMATHLIVGTDYRVHWSSDGVWFEVTAAPLHGGEPYDSYPDEESVDTLYDQSYWSEGDDLTSPPTVKAHVAEHSAGHVGWNNYAGVWRGAVVIEFGKDLPSFSDALHRLPNREFVQALEGAFRADLAEVGEFY